MLGQEILSMIKVRIFEAQLQKLHKFWGSLSQAGEQNNQEQKKVMQNVLLLNTSVLETKVTQNHICAMLVCPICALSLPDRRDNSTGMDTVMGIHTFSRWCGIEIVYTGALKTKNIMPV